MKAHAARHPVRFAVLVALALVVIDGTLALALPRLVDDDRVRAVAIDFGQYALAVGLLASLGWWRRAGFATLPRARSLFRLFPLFLLLGLQALAFKLGTHDGLMIVVLVEAALAAGITEEVLFRGVILRALEPLGLFSAAAISAVLFGLVHLVNLTLGANMLATVDQTVTAVGLGFAFAAVVLVTGSIWPAIVIHTAMDTLGMLTAGDLINREAPDASVVPLMVTDTVFLVLLVGYGSWLLRRHTRKSATPHAPLPSAPDARPGRHAVAGN